jgi:hypothetical protein
VSRNTGSPLRLFHNKRSDVYPCLVFKGPPHALGVASDDGEIGACGLAVLGASLLPIAQRAERNAVPRCEFFLSQSKRPAQGLGARDPFGLRQLFGVKGRASGSRDAAASTSASVIGASGSTGTTSSVPSGLILTSTPSRRILAIVVVLLMSRCSPRRDNSNAFAPLGVNDGQHLSVGHAEQDRTLLAVGFAFVDPLDGKWVVEGEGGLLEAHAMIAEALRTLANMARCAFLVTVFGLVKSGPQKIIADGTRQFRLGKLAE